MVKTETDHLKIRNKIYETIFDDGWAKRNIDSMWLAYSAISVLAISLIGFITLFAWDFINDNRATWAEAAIMRADSEEKERTEAAQILFCDPIMPIIGNPHHLKGINAIGQRGRWGDQEKIYDHKEYLNQPDCLVKVIEEMSVSLAYSDEEDTLWMLKVMHRELTYLQKAKGYEESRDLTKGLLHWIEAREFYKNNNFDGAIDAYGKAIELIPNNPAVTFDRGLAYALRGDTHKDDFANADFEAALVNFEAVLAMTSLTDVEPPPTPVISREVDVETLPIGTTTQSPSPAPDTPTPLLATRSQDPLPTSELIVEAQASESNPITSTSTLLITETPTPSNTPPPTETPTPSNTPPPTETPTPNGPVQPKFHNQSDRWGMVRDFIAGNPNLSAALISKDLAILKADFPNLNQFVVPQIPPTVTPVPIVALEATSTSQATLSLIPPTQTVLPQTFQFTVVNSPPDAFVDDGNRTERVPSNGILSAEHGQTLRMVSNEFPVEIQLENRTFLVLGPESETLFTHDSKIDVQLA